MNFQLVTSNLNKFRELSELLELNLSHIELDLHEIQTTDLHELVKLKLLQAYEHTQMPVIVEDTSLYFMAWNELPGPLIKFFLNNLGITGMVKALKEFNDYSASAKCCLGFTKNGKNMQVFDGIVKGVIVNPRGTRHFGWDTIFLPNGHKKTFGEMTLYEKNQISHRGLAAKKLNQFLTLQVKQK